MKATDAGLDDLAACLEVGQPRAVGRAISLAERGGKRLAELARRIQSRTGRARLVGITGAPGAGKSTLTSALIQALRGRGETVGVLAVDPTSPYSGGALLGDRVRMPAVDGDPGVFIRSMATRGAMGGLARAAHDALDILDAAGFEWLLVETVGVGQDEVDIVRCVDTVVVVTVPGAGDEIQALKAGLMEIADIFVLNKADQEGAGLALRDLEMMLGLRSGLRQPCVVETVATRGQGVDELLAAIDRHIEYLQGTGEGDRRSRARLRFRVETILQERVLAAAERYLDLDDEVTRGRESGRDPYRVADRVFAAVTGFQSRRQSSDPEAG